MRTTRSKVIIIVVLFAAAIGVTYIFVSNKASDSSLKRTYSLTDFPTRPSDPEASQRLLDVLNNDVRALRTNATSTNPYMTWVDIGNMKLALGDYTGARSAYEEAIKINSQSPLAYLNLGTLYKMHLKDCDRSERYYNLALERIDVPFFSDYTSVAELYESYCPNKKIDIEQLMLKGADKTLGTDKANYYQYLFMYFKGSDDVKSEFYKQKVLELDPSRSILD